MAGVKMGVRQFAERGHELSTGRIALIEGHCLAQGRDRGVVGAAEFEHLAQHREGLDPGRVGRRQALGGDGNGLPRGGLRGGEIGPSRLERPELDQGRRHIRVIGAEQRPPLGDRRVEQGVGPLQVAQLLMDAAKGQKQLRLGARVSVEALGIAETAVEEGHHPKAVGRTGRLVAPFE